MILGRIRFLFNPLLMVGKKVVFLLRGFELQDVFLYIQTKTILPKTLKVLGGKNPRNSDFYTLEK